MAGRTSAAAKAVPGQAGVPAKSKAKRPRWRNKKSAPFATNALCTPLAGADNGEMSNLNFASQRPPAHRAPRRGGQAGFSLMEAMVVAAIVAIMAVLAVPSFSGMVQRQRVKNAADAVLSDLRWARSEAIKRGKHTKLTVTSDANGWQYSVYEDGNQDSIKNVSVNDFPGVALNKKNSNQGSWSVRFEPVRGTTVGDEGSNQFTNITLVVSSGSDTSNTKSVVVSSLGRIRVE